jgi:cobalamin biosynthesis protein CobT
MALRLACHDNAVHCRGRRGAAPSSRRGRAGSRRRRGTACAAARAGGPRLACHDNAVHRRLAPENAAARAVYDAVEQARVEVAVLQHRREVAGHTGHPARADRLDPGLLDRVVDSMALRLACHDNAVHRRLAPENAAARAVYDAVEQVFQRRVGPVGDLLVLAAAVVAVLQHRREVAGHTGQIGSRRMAGVAGNLTAMLEDRYHRGGKYEEITDRASARRGCARPGPQ